jgi:hypothetical protein
MAAVAVDRQPGVTSVRVTRCALNRDVCSGKWKHRRRMIERGGCPRNIRMTNRAVVRTLGGDVIQRSRSDVIRLVTAVAIGRQSRIAPARVAG